MKLYFVAIRHGFETIFAAHVLATHPVTAKKAAVEQFLKPLDVAAMPDELNRKAAADLETLCAPKRAAFNRGECEVKATLSKANRNQASIVAS